ncbi:phosphate signaling complex protein PhoU [Caldilinea sp.]|uniref:phosphate signaling complex protein PhoU n=1 Tax=Caldilinea sp. TaxID=2293560 RepID=UPI002BB50D22|nr:phosphate signaling complex protein PhoU [Anaerolineales bacterium]HQY92447.1 phosphate signaling complex protein PhoU [Caldilinea sp.]HRA68242.1 phosphate signaling complex protein PhoU [Caldilinea sp.]
MKPREHFDRELQQLSDSIMVMASRVEEQLSIVLTAYERLDPALASVVSDLDRQVNKMRFEIEERCILLIAKQQPAARDLRLIIASLNMIVDLERMGDQTKGVSKALHHLHGRPRGTVPPEIAEMGRMVLEMLRSVKVAYANRNIQLAQHIAAQDDEVDKLYARAFTQIMYQLAGCASPDEAKNEYEVLRIAREFERFGDLVTNVAERLIFIVTGSMEEINIEPDAAQN